MRNAENKDLMSPSDIRRNPDDFAQQLNETHDKDRFIKETFDFNSENGITDFKRLLRHAKERMPSERERRLRKPLRVYNPRKDDPNIGHNIDPEIPVWEQIYLGLQNFAEYDLPKIEKRLKDREKKKMERRSIDKERSQFKERIKAAATERDDALTSDVDRFVTKLAALNRANYILGWRRGFDKDELKQSLLDDLDKYRRIKEAGVNKGLKIEDKGDKFKVSTGPKHKVKVFYLRKNKRRKAA